VSCSRSSNLARAKSRTVPDFGSLVCRNSLITVISQDGMEESASSRKASRGPPSLSNPGMLSRASKKRTSSKSRLMENTGFHRFVRCAFLGRLLDFFTLPVALDIVRIGEKHMASVRQQMLFRREIQLEFAMYLVHSILKDP
jgi:hypothetical protein